MAQKALIVSAPLGEIPSIKFSDTVGYILQKASIMGNEDYCALKVGQLLLEPAYSRDVQVIRRLIQQ